MLDELITSLNDRFSEGQEAVMKGFLMLPSSIITVDSWETALKPFLDLYRDKLPTCRDLSAQLQLWKQKWKDEWGGALSGRPFKSNMSRQWGKN